MSKQITHEELAEIVTKLLTTNEIDDAEVFARFMTGIAQTVCDFCGGEIREEAELFDGVWLVGVHGNDSLPWNGGIWKDYDVEGALWPEGEMA